jgi:CheY-like chemotaxis protein
MIDALRPDVVILDLDLRHQAPWDLLERLHSEVATRGIPILVTSTDRRLLDRVAADFDRLGGQRFLEKPLDLAALVDAVKELTA